MRQSGEDMLALALFGDGAEPGRRRLLFLPTVYLTRVTTLCKGLWPKCLLLIESEILRLRLSVSPEVVSFYMSTESKWSETLYVSSATAFCVLVNQPGF